MPAKFGYHSTADEVLASHDLAGYTAVITGGNSGLGAETVRALAKAGAKAILTSRNLEVGERVTESINSSHKLKHNVVAQQLDLADLQSIQNCATALMKFPNIDLLVLNAGIMACPKQYTKHGFELQMGTNVHGHFYLIKLLAQKLKSQERACRIIILSSEGHRFGAINLSDLHFKKGRWYNKWWAYGQSKLGDILLAKELNVRFANSGVTAFSVHPGIISDTNLFQHSGFFSFGVRLFRSRGKSIAQGASTSVFACVDEDLLKDPGAYLCNCQVSTPSKQAENMELAKALYDKINEELEEALASNISK